MCEGDVLLKKAVRAKSLTICNFASCLGLVAQQASLLISVKDKIFFIHGEEVKEDPAVLRYVLRWLKRSHWFNYGLALPRVKSTKECACFCLCVFAYSGGKGFCVCACACVSLRRSGCFFSLSFFALSFLFLFNLIGKSGRDQLPTRERKNTLLTGGKQVWLEVGNYRGGDKRAGQIRGLWFSSIGKSPVGSSEWCSTRTAHADDLKTHHLPVACSPPHPSPHTYTRLSTGIVW